MWNLLVDPQGNPKLPGASSCGDGCRGVAQVSTDGSVQLNQECEPSKLYTWFDGYLTTWNAPTVFAIAHAAKAILPKDVNGPFGRRIGYALNGNSASTLTVGAYVTERAKAGDPSRYSLVVMNS